MTGIIELDRDGQHLLIRFPYREDLVDEVRNLPGRRWDRNRKVWRVPATHAEAVVSTMMRHGFEVTSEVTSIVAGTAAAPAPTKLAVAPRPHAVAANQTLPLSVSALNTRVRDHLRGAFPSNLLVVGEIVDLDKRNSGKHLFFTLVEKAPGGQRIAAAVEAVMFEGAAARILPELERHHLSLRDGIEILVEARVDLYPASGRFQLVIEAIRPEFTLGRLALSRDEILEELARRRLDRSNLERAMGTPPLRIGVLSSPDSDGWNDFLAELAGAGIGFEVGLFPIKVQGADLKPTLMAGLRWFARHAAAYDVLCVLRGGGSRTDLAGFDDLDLAIEVAQHPLKVLCGIGHQRDQTVLDAITESVKTPTAAAARLVAAVASARDSLASAQDRLATDARDAVAAARRELAAGTDRLARRVGASLVVARQGILSASLRLSSGTRTGLRSATAAIDRRWDRVDGAARAMLRAEWHGTAALHRDVARAARARVCDTRVAIDSAADRLRLLDPRRVLARGYALVRDSAGRIATGVDRLKPGADAVIVFRDGTARTTVASVHRQPPEEKIG
jgi:exodeoxyribonuclease VII large subunit